MTGQVDTDDTGIVRIAPPVWQRFIGQPVSNLSNWLLMKFGTVQMEEL